MNQKVSTLNKSAELVDDNLFWDINEDSVELGGLDTFTILSTKLHNNLLHIVLKVLKR